VNIFIADSSKKHDYIKNVKPDVILNRYDLSFDDDYQIIVAEEDGKPLYVPIRIAKREASLGIYMCNVDSVIPGAFDAIKDFIFKNFNVDAIGLKHTLTPFDGAEHTKHCHVELPETIEEFDNTLSHRVRYNTKWYPKKIRENIGEISFEKIDASDCPSHIFDLYFKWKYQSHNRHYHITPKEYIKKCGITRAYILHAGPECLAIGFISETGNNVYFENFSYNQKYKKWSPGMVLYYEIIKDLIAEHKKIFYLLGAHDYKIHYNGIVTETYTGHIYKSQEKIDNLKKLAIKLKKLPKFIRKIVILIYANVFLSKPYKHFLKDEVNK
jgi:hypothetical protein